MAGTSTLMALKAQNEARQAETRAVADRRRNLAVLMLQHLYEMGYSQSAAALSAEAGAGVSKVGGRFGLASTHVCMWFSRFRYRTTLFRRPGSGSRQTTSVCW
jgi:hypothetical protein